jgi:hypothetical protein
MSDPKEPFVPRADRPDLALDPEAPIAQLKVRDLHLILSGTVLKVIQDHKIIEKHFKHEKLEKFEKHEKLEKHEKHEKHEKLEWEKIHKPEKLEYEVYKNTPEGIPDPTNQIDPVARRGLEQVIDQIAGLAKQLEEIQKKLG